jgi:hypothetical protein
MSQIQNSAAHRPRYPQLAKEPLLTTKLRPNPENRVMAKVIDLFIVEVLIWAVAFFWKTGAWVLPVVYWAWIDRVGRGQSPGKWLLGLHTIEQLKGTRLGFYHGLVRNFPFVLLSTGLGLEGFWGWAVLSPAAFCLLLEAYFIFNVRSGVRVGDILANTRVFDYKDEHTKFIEQFLKEEESV